MKKLAQCWMKTLLIIILHLYKLKCFKTNSDWMSHAVRQYLPKSLILSSFTRPNLVPDTYEFMNESFVWVGSSQWIVWSSSQNWPACSVHKMDWSGASALFFFLRLDSTSFHSLCQHITHYLKRYASKTKRGFQALKQPI